MNTEIHKFTAHKHTELAGEVQALYVPIYICISYKSTKAAFSLLTVRNSLLA